MLECNEQFGNWVVPESEVYHSADVLHFTLNHLVCVPGPMQLLCITWNHHMGLHMSFLKPSAHTDKLSVAMILLYQLLSKYSFISLINHLPHGKQAIQLYAP